MAIVHFLNVGSGDCSIIQHDSGRVSVIDICNGGRLAFEKMLEAYVRKAVPPPTSLGSGDFRMRETPTDPIDYLERIGVTESVFRFILTHPDMDHMQGFKALNQRLGIVNFWDSGVRKAKPNFSGSPFSEADWDEYVRVRDGNTDVNVVRPRARDIFQYATSLGGDGLHVLAPDRVLVDQANRTGDVNDASYVLALETAAGLIVFGGDAHDDTWDFVIRSYGAWLKGCSVLIAPHHGRASDRCYDYLDVLQPKLVLFGCAPSEHLAYNACHSRDLPLITNNQAGNVILVESAGGIEVYVENERFARTCQGFNGFTTHGAYYIGRIGKRAA